MSLPRPVQRVETARRILGEVDEADEAAAGINAAPRGPLTVTAPGLFGKMFVMPGIVDYLVIYTALAGLPQRYYAIAATVQQ